MVPNSPVRPVQALLDDFAERHHLERTDLLERETVAIQSLAMANILVNEAYSRLDDAALADPTIGLMLNLLHRNVEHAEASVVAFVTGCASSAEIVARASVESSVNIAYILAGDRSARLFGYFDHYLENLDAQVEKWRREVGKLDRPEAKIHELAIDTRRKATATIRGVVDSLGIVNAERWPPQIAQRFDAIGAGISHRTFYARMSSEVHADAEETLRYFVGNVADDGSFLEAMASESVWTSRYYVYYAASWFMRASLAYARSYSLPAVATPLETALATIERKLIEISVHIGAKF